MSKHGVSSRTFKVVVPLENIYSEQLEGSARSVDLGQTDFGSAEVEILPIS